MKRVVLVLTAVIIVAACTAPSTGIFARVDVACGATALIFSNADQIDEKIAVRASDQCAGMDSEIQLVAHDEKVVKRFPLRDGTTDTIHIIVPAQHSLNFVCRGSSGGCSYAVTSE